ncbi:MAG TPA: hypothetical protein ENL13_00170, partial [Thermoplasmatales archaeon]|nr:hypothetical protein [Thermoplasmatales archaeon]
MKKGICIAPPLIVVVLMLLSSALPAVTADSNIRENVKGYDRGVSWQPVVPLKKATFVNFDENSYLDDYSYLAAVPTTVFYDKDGGRLFSYPLLFYQDPYPVKEDKERSLNARQGLNYFMEDWMSYCNGRLDGLTLINVDKNKVTQWPSRNTTTITGDNPFSVASQIALHDWSYSDNAVVAVIKENFEKPNEITKGKIDGKMFTYNVGHKHFEMEQPIIGTGGTYSSFNIDDENYKYVIAQLSWPNHIDLDLQLYDSHLGMVDNAAGVYSDPRLETTGSYIHNYGKWQVSVTAVPKKGFSDTGSEKDLFNAMSFKELSKEIKNKCDVDVLLYPGVKFNLPKTPFGCRNASFTLRWNNPGVKLGFAVLDPVDNEICSSLSKEEIISGDSDNKNETTIHINQLGECRDGENYSICVFSVNNVSQPVDFRFDYSWQQNFSKEESDCFVSATNGAVLASTLNAPLLYVSPSQLPKCTKEALYKLGVKNIYLLNIGGHLSANVKNELKGIASIKEEYKDARNVYSGIKGLSGRSGDIIFTTIDPWTYWYVSEGKPAGETKAALFVGPASYIAAQHGSPVVVVDEHPRLSQAVVYHDNFWRKNADSRATVEPSSGSMFLS